MKLVKIVKDSWVLGRQILAGKASREVYFLFATAKISSFLLGLLIGAKFL